MSKRIRKCRAVLGVLGRLGSYASPSDVVAELAKYGIEVSAGMVQKIEIEAARDTSRLRRQMARAAITGSHPKPRVIRTIPAGRSGRK